jgi:hypothetical protein
VTARHKLKYLHHAIIEAIQSARDVPAAQPMNVKTQFRSRKALRAR